jgi:acetyl esterase/lipase
LGPFFDPTPVGQIWKASIAFPFNLNLKSTSPRLVTLFWAINSPVRKIALLFILGVLHGGAEPTPVTLWPGTPPGDTAGAAKNDDIGHPWIRDVAGRPIRIIDHISEPILTLYRPAANLNTGAAIVVFPGGGYNALAIDLEGTEVCAWLNSIGVTGILVRYRVPQREGRPRYSAPLQDAQRAMGIVRAHVSEWGIDPKRIGVMGFSAGGNLCAVLSANSAARTYGQVDRADDEPCRPAFQILIYPAYLVSEKNLFALVPEVAVTPGTPPTFMAMAEDDEVHVENVLAYASALKQAGVSFELFVCPKGGHGFGLRPAASPVTAWPARAEEWMRFSGFLDRPAGATP